MRPVLLAAILAVGVRAAEPLGHYSQGWLENDLVVNTDRHYTHGSKFSHMFPEHTDGDGSRVDSLYKYLPSMGLKNDFTRWGMSLGQNIYTPDDIFSTTLVADDRPYAGYLYTSWHLASRGTFGEKGIATQDSWTVDLGIVGPGSGAEQAQNTIHRIRNFEEAMGWDNQLQNEPAVNLRYARVFRLSAGTPGGWESQFLPHYGLSAGSVFTYAGAGAQIRLGWNLPENFGHRNIGDTMPNVGGRVRGETSRFSAHLFATFEGRAVGWNMLLDGNIFHNSHSVDKEVVVGEFKAGAVISYGWCELALMQVVRSREYKLQDSFDTYGSISLGVRW
jgi:lipid A 3-O-deacylase